MIIRHDRARDAKTGVDVVTPSIAGRNGTLFLVAGKIVPQGVEGDGILRRIHVMRRYPLEIVKAPVHQVAHIRPPVVGVHHHTDEVMVIARTRDDLNKVGGSVIPWFPTVDAGIPEEELVAVDERNGLMVSPLGNNVGQSPTNLMNNRAIHAILAQYSEIVSAGIVACR